MNPFVYALVIRYDLAGFASEGQPVLIAIDVSALTLSSRLSLPYLLQFYSSQTIPAGLPSFLFSLPLHTVSSSPAYSPYPLTHANPLRIS